MGNYKEGYLELYLKKDTPFTVIESLVDLSYFDGDFKNGKDLRAERIQRLKKNRTEKFFEGNIENLHIELSPQIKGLDSTLNGMIDLKGYAVYSYCIDHYITDLKMFEDLYCDDNFTNGIGITAIKSALKKRRFEKIFVEVRVNSKRYYTEFDDLIDFLRPFLIENHPNKLGHVEDEDGYLRKDFYLDSNLFNKEMQKRKVVCEGCIKSDVSWALEFSTRVLTVTPVGPDREIITEDLTVDRDDITEVRELDTLINVYANIIERVGDTFETRGEKAIEKFISKQAEIAKKYDAAKNAIYSKYVQPYLFANGLEGEYTWVLDFETRKITITK